MFVRHTLILAAALTALTACAAQPAQQAQSAQPVQQAQQPAARPKAQARELSRAEFETLLATPEKLLILDVRRPDELTKFGGFPVFLSVQIKELEKSLAWIPKDRTIVTVSNHAARSGRAADFLT